MIVQLCRLLAGFETTTLWFCSIICSKLKELFALLKSSCPSSDEVSKMLYFGFLNFGFSS